MEYSAFIKKMSQRFKRLNIKKYIFYLLTLALILTAFLLSKQDTTLTFSFITIYLTIILVDLVFELSGYFRGPEKRIAIIKKIVGYIIGTLILALIIAASMKVIDIIF